MQKNKERHNLYLLRVGKKLSQGEMAKRCGVAYKTYWNIEKGLTDGALAFWLKLKEEFPEITIENMAKVEELPE